MNEKNLTGEQLLNIKIARLEEKVKNGYFQNLIKIPLSENASCGFFIINPSIFRNADKNLSIEEMLSKGISECLDKIVEHKSEDFTVTDIVSAEIDEETGLFNVEYGETMEITRSDYEKLLKIANEMNEEVEAVVQAVKEYGGEELYKNHLKEFLTMKYLDIYSIIEPYMISQNIGDDVLGDDSDKRSDRYPDIDEILDELKDKFEQER